MLSKRCLRQCVIVIDLLTHTAFDIAVDAEVNFGRPLRGRAALKQPVVVIFPDEFCVLLAIMSDFIEESVFPSVCMTHSLRYDIIVPSVPSFPGLLNGLSISEHFPLQKPCPHLS